MPTDDEAIQSALYGPGGIGGMYGTDCERAFRAGWRARDLEIDRLRSALKEIQTNVEPLAEGGPTVGQAAWYFQIIRGICRAVESQT